MRSGDGFICVYSITIAASFVKVREFYEHVLRVKDVESIPFIIVGNKCDLEKQRKVTTSSAKELASEIGAMSLETSAKTGANVVLAFYSVVREIKKWKAEHEKPIGDDSSSKKKGLCSLL